jgi:hypothetical protein
VNNAEFLECGPAPGFFGAAYSKQLTRAANQNG